MKQQNNSFEFEKQQFPKKTILTIFLILAIVVSGCTTKVDENNEPKACTMDAKVCDDGSAVGRNPDNNCDFFDCPLATKVDVKFRDYAANSIEQCAATTFICDVEGTKAFFDKSGCGCEAVEPKLYTSKDLEQCKLIKFICIKNHVPFQDEVGCGCEFSWEQVKAAQEEQQNGAKLQAYDCPETRTQACTREYMPVCGQVQVECIRAPCDPVKQTFSNKCEACANDRTISYFQGACEDENLAEGTVLAGSNSEQCTNMGGTWTGFDCEGISQNQCQEIGGTFNECASACRNDPNAEICTMQCVQVCTFDQ